MTSRFPEPSDPPAKPEDVLKAEEILAEIDAERIAHARHIAKKHLMVHRAAVAKAEANLELAKLWLAKREEQLADADAAKIAFSASLDDGTFLENFDKPAPRTIEEDDDDGDEVPCTVRARRSFVR